MKWVNDSTAKKDAAGKRPATQDAIMTGSSPLHGSNDSAARSHAHSILWIDGIGGFLLWDKPELIVGQAFSESQADIGIMGDLSRRAAALRRMGADYLIQPLQNIKVDGNPIDRPQLLRDGCVAELSSSVKVRFEKPNTLSGTALLKMASIHRWKPNVDAVILFADCCIIGPRVGSHIYCPQWRHEVLLLRKADTWQLRVAEEVQVGEATLRGQIAIHPGVRIRGEDFSLSLE